MLPAINNPAFWLPFVVAAAGAGGWFRFNGHRSAGKGLDFDAQHPKVSEPAAFRAQFVQHAQRASQIDHDLRTPLGTITSALALMESAPDDVELRAEALQVIGRQVGQMTTVTERLRRHVGELESAGSDRRQGPPAN